MHAQQTNEDERVETIKSIIAIDDEIRISPLVETWRVVSILTDGVDVIGTPRTPSDNGRRFVPWRHVRSIVGKTKRKK